MLLCDVHACTGTLEIKLPELSCGFRAAAIAFVRRLLEKHSSLSMSSMGSGELLEATGCAQSGTKSTHQQRLTLM